MLSFLIKIKDNWKSGLSIAFVSLPLAVSLAVASNTTPIVGIVTAIWAGLVASIFGGSNYNVIGPTGALTGILAGYAIMYGPASLSMLAILSGIFIFLAFFFKLEKYIIFFPSNCIHGFILGVSCIIIFTQVNNALGLTNVCSNKTILGNLLESLRNLSQTSIPVLIFFMIFLIAIFVVPKIISFIPSLIILTPVAIFIGFLSSKKFIPVVFPTLESRYSSIKAAIFLPHNFNFSLKFIIPALVIAIISIIETMLSARIADAMTKTKHNQRREMLALSFANIASGIAGGIPATAALARTTINIKSGATNKISATLSGIFLLVISIILLPYFKYMPLCAIAAMLVSIAITMIEKKHFIKMYRLDKKDFFIAFIVAGITIYEDAIMGILFGATVSSIFLMIKLSEGHFELTEDFVEEKSKDIAKIENKFKKTNTIIYSIKGKFAYINVQSHLSRFENNPIPQKNIIIDLRDLYFIDLDGIEAFNEIVNFLHSKKKVVLISSVRPFIGKKLEESLEFKKLEKDNLVFESVYKCGIYLDNIKPTST